MTIIVYIVGVVFASWLIAKACDGFEVAADYLGRNMTEGTKGATINAIGSSMPELCVTFIYLFLFHDTTGFSGGIGTTAGSAVFNTMVIPALVILFVLWRAPKTEIVVSKKTVLRDGLVLIFAELFLIYFLGSSLSWYHGFSLMLIYVVYACFMIWQNKHNTLNENTEPENKKDESHLENDDSHKEETIEKLDIISKILAFLKVDLESAIINGKELKKNNSILLLAVSTSYIVIACWILVFACEHIGFSLGIHGYFVAVIIAAAASSVPDTILSIKDAGKGNYNDALSKALGSNIFDICFALGAPLFLYTLLNGTLEIPAQAIENIIELRILLLILTIIAFFIFLRFKKMTKKMSYILLSMYLLFVLYVAGRAAESKIVAYIADILHGIQKIIQ